MVYLNVRHTVADYGKWRPIYDEDQTRRKENGATGVEQVYRNVDNPNMITVMIEWDSAENALKFANDPALAEVMQKAGVVGRPELIAVLSRA